MEQQPNLETCETPNHSQQDVERFINRISTAVDWEKKHKAGPGTWPEDEAGDLLSISFLLSNIEPFENRFTQSDSKARRFYRDSKTYRNTIAQGTATPEDKKIYTELFPHSDLAKSFRQHINAPAPKEIPARPAPKPKKKPQYKRAEKWKLDTRWDHLWRSSQAVYLEMQRRTQYPKDPKEFPWTQTGIESLHKFTHYSKRQIQDALAQLERFKLIKRIVKGNEFQGCSKFHVFLTPKMSGRFSRLAPHA